MQGRQAMIIEPAAAPDHEALKDGALVEVEGGSTTDVQCLSLPKHCNLFRNTTSPFKS
jgi:Ethanolamine utilization protein EutJ (predicted chaperonin)